ncbi:MAG TPA: hypothetical protein ENH35_05700, partial [Candidatus Moranbacteria bacterium]|nr:hypothetical protein [Candidatus Moranbacteria bacterium]
MELKQLLLLKEKGESNRSCERILGIHRNTINHYVRLFRASGLSYRNLCSLDEKALQELFPYKETIDEYVSILVDREWEEKQNKKIKNLIKNARFRFEATLQDIDYTANRQLDKNTFQRLALLGFIPNKENIIITGATGTGKSYLAQA